MTKFQSKPSSSGSRWRRFLHFFTAILVGLALNTPARSAYPERSIVIVVPLTPGGSVDLFARNAARKLQERLGKTVIVENRPGGNMMIGAESVVRAKPDGHTILLVGSTMLSTSATAPSSLRFDIIKDLQPVMRAANVPLALAANTTAPFGSVREMIAWAKGSPGKLSIAVTPGAGSLARLALEKMKAEANFFAVPIPYSGAAPAIQALIANDVPAVITDLNTILPQAAAGRVKVLGVLAGKRLKSQPDFPTISEGGIAGFSVETWIGFYVPAGTPKDVVRVLNKEFAEILAMPDIQASMNTGGLEGIGGTPEEASAVIATEIAYWQKLVRDRALKFD